MEFASAEEFTNYASSTGRSYVEIVLEQNGEYLGSLTLELFTDICPRTCQNFVELIQGTKPDGSKYKGSCIHRVVKHAFIQGGDVVNGTGKGDPGWTIADETFQVKHDAPGILAMANNGEPHSGSSQFYITLAPLAWLDNKRVAFGKVITAEGMDTLRKIEDSPISNERPINEITVKSCGVVLLGSS